MDVSTEFILLPRLLIATVLGGVVGYEREIHGRAAGIRTYAAVSLGAAMFTIINAHVPNLSDHTRIVSNIVTGIGFLGAGIIFRDAGNGLITGLTTAATLWATAAVGVAAGFGMYVISLFSTITLFLLLYLNNAPFIKRLKSKGKIFK
ncbi:MgtC/SapB family protein [Sediminibacterium sp.]|uniref:MgtC/SapB family protein n=1 Tax=Sediminibacterium sp. TaxID=1917865 RepID=UPI0025E95EAE|nr:MgtC/SapB family protein [Sediminibacterium sp.]MDP3393353.1 MgtC/SapB family protein [Sediminibacterium sp.]MDP3567955.1 MgtC/SapB family protein [Sediminibacterium sp.]